MYISRWALFVMFLATSMFAGMTVVAGFYAWRGADPAPQPALAADAHFGRFDVAAPGHVREVRDLRPEEAASLSEGGQVDPDPVVVRSSGAAFPPPKYAAGAGIDPRMKSVNSDDPRRAASLEQDVRGVVVLDPGHGRGDPGATHYLSDGSGRWDITEAESNLLNAELIRDELVAMGYEVYLTREGAGRGPGAPLPRQFIVSDLFSRVALSSAVDADVYLAIHGNGAVVKSIRGPETWYCGKHQEGAANRRLAEMVQQAMMDALREYGYDAPDRGIKEDAASRHSGDFCQFVVTRETEVPAALLEFLFLSNDDDARVLVDRRSHELMAKHVAAALDAFLQERGR
jgi:N-acetylmuramoyl-L-alanine amidase